METTRVRRTSPKATKAEELSLRLTLGPNPVVVRRQGEDVVDLTGTPANLEVAVRSVKSHGWTED